ncbi:MAG: helix-turn-helix transcriptional regulator [Clostridia bacterium]|nr:helix-turn-helix transcriptional regulator [Clostridia bacterium]
MKFSEKLGIKIRKERKMRGWTQEDFANAIVMSPRHYGDVERGSVNVGVNTVERIAMGFDMDTSELFLLDEDIKA